MTNVPIPLGSKLLLMATVLALLLANSSVAPVYFAVLHTTMLGASLLHIINDGLMTLFFLLIGLELKRELLLGQLASVRRAVLPVIAAVGGMLVPAILYFLLNSGGVAAAGWGIPMATDIAFAIGILSLLGNRIPKSVAILLVALAIVDDLGAVLVIALFYTQSINLDLLLVCGGLIVILLALNVSGVKQLAPYLVTGVLLWCAMLASGVHATIAGVILAFGIPVQSTGKLEHWLDKPVSWVVVPVFAFANAGVSFQAENLVAQVLNPVALGVVCGLVVGKVLGISGATWLAVKMHIASLPRDLQMQHIVGMGLLGGIGFTMSIFIADLGFAGDSQLLLQAKTGILLASFISAISGTTWLWIYKRRL